METTLKESKRFTLITLLLCVLFLFLFCSIPRISRAQARVRFPDAHERPPEKWTGRVFRLSQDYPIAMPDSFALPWRDIDFVTKPVPYMMTVLKYAYLDNITDNDWQPEKNTTNPWYHAPWLHWGSRGREFIRGMTRERRSRPCELSGQQEEERQTWAVSVYNELGGYVLGRVWDKPWAPNPAAAVFPEGTVAIKVLFTQATATEVPYLQGAPEWEANIEVRPGAREQGNLRLLQIDFAVRDKRADPWTGWVFGTFQYSADAPGERPWDKVVPVALTWGNDPYVTPDDIKGGKKLAESWINPDAPIVKYRRSVCRTMGWAGRANGPVDDDKSACLSCHSTAQSPPQASLAPPGTAKLDSDKLPWFRNLGPGQAFSPEAQSLSYSLQLSVGIQNFYSWVESVQTLNVVEAPSSPPSPRQSCKPCEAPASSGESKAMAGKAQTQPSHRSTSYWMSRDPVESQPMPPPP